jgi:hypothetical protein
LAEATRLAAKEPGRYAVGANGWVKITWAGGEPPPTDLLVRWVEESYRLLAPKPLVAELSAGGPVKTKAAKKAAKPRGQR